MVKKCFLYMVLLIIQVPLIVKGEDALPGWDNFNEGSNEPVNYENSRPEFEASASFSREKKDKSELNSLLVSGYWYKIKVAHTGIYKLSYGDILEMGFTNPANIKVFGNGGRQLSYRNSDPRPVDLNEIPIYMNKGSDGVFNADDYILFYAEGPVVWELDEDDQFFMEKIHGYTDGICYFLTTSPGPAKTIETINNNGLTSNVSVTGFNDLAYYEKERFNLIMSGRIWYSLRVDGSPFDTIFTFQNHIPNSLVRVKAGTAGRSIGIRSSFLRINNQVVDTITYSKIDVGYSWYTYAKTGFFDYSFPLNSDEFALSIDYEKYELSDECYLDNVTVNARSHLVIREYPFFFRDLNSVGPGNIASYSLSNAAAGMQLWDITHINETKAIQGVLTGTNYVFKAPADQLREYVVLDPLRDYPRPVMNASEAWVGVVPNQNLRGLPVYNYIIITADEFLVQANRLADFHRSKSKLSVLVVTPELIYNEFSAGTPDVSAMRDFLRQQYIKSSTEDSLRYVLLFGDGSFINHIYAKGNTNYILTFESDNSLSPTSSYTSDDFFCLLGEDEGDIQGDLTGTLDIGLGRLPVKLVDGSDYEARDVVNKIIRYDTSKYTDWRRTLCFVGDDGYDGGGASDGVRHMDDANSFANYVENNYSGFELRKVYLDAYPQVVTSTGAAYPEVNRELDNLFHKGILIFCYSGHGSENQITSEKILQKQDVMAMKNNDVLPLFITATCSFGRYDHVDIEDNNLNKLVAQTTAGEEALLNPEGGAIALLTTSRVVYPGANKDLVLEVLSRIFQKDSTGKPYRFGDIVRLAKNGPSLISDENKRNFALLGDPALTLKYPLYRVLTDSINHKSVTTFDTLKAYSTATVSGFVAYDDSTIISDFNGFVYPHVYDKMITFTTFGNDDQTPYTYHDQKNLLYRGKATVTNGRFTFSFVVPKDISYAIGPGKISYYAENGEIDALGEFREVNVGGTDENAIVDNMGPEIDLYLNDERFADGGMTNNEPFLYAIIEDESGINTSGAGFGHDITAILDEKDTDPFILNDYYEATVDDYRSGKIKYQIRNLEEGPHQLSLKVWDVINNSSDAVIGFVVASTDGLVIDKLLCFPNPTNVPIQFQYTHNSPDEMHEILLEVFDMSGRMVAQIAQMQFETGYVSVPFYWDLTGTGGQMLSAGLYTYRFSVTTSIGSSHVNQKLIILR